jgi:hypothetical protein
MSSTHLIILQQKMRSLGPMWELTNSPSTMTVQTSMGRKTPFKWLAITGLCTPLKRVMTTTSPHLQTALRTASGTTPKPTASSQIPSIFRRVLMKKLPLRGMYIYMYIYMYMYVYNENLVMYMKVC